LRQKRRYNPQWKTLFARLSKTTTPLTSAESANFKTSFSSYQTLISSAC